MRFSKDAPIGPALQAAGVELDQKLAEALKTGHALASQLTQGSGDSTRRLTDSGIFHALNRLNAITARSLDLDRMVANLKRSKPFLLASSERIDDPEKLRPNEFLCEVLDTALEKRKNTQTLGTRDFLEAVVELSLRRGDEYSRRPLSCDVLVSAFGRSSEQKLSEVKEAEELLHDLKSQAQRSEDFQYTLAVENDRIVFRINSVLGDFIQSDSGILTPRRALLNHFQEKFGAFAPEQILELEDLLNSGGASEADFQRFFERFPHFLRKWDLREVHPQVYLAREDQGPLIPDFILTDTELQKAMILELKLPSPRLVTRRRNRDRFAAAVADARAQLLRYRDWFRDPRNRAGLKDKVGLEIYEPRLAVIVGRSREFLDEFDRQQLHADSPEIEVVTYDDILTFASRRRIDIQE